MRRGIQQQHGVKRTVKKKNFSDLVSTIDEPTQFPVKPTQVVTETKGETHEVTRSVHRRRYMNTHVVINALNPRLDMN